MKKPFTKHSIRFACCWIFAVFSISARAQTLVNKSWVKTTGLPDAINWTGSSFDSNKNLIFVGNTVTAPGNANLLITKYQPDGNIAWQRVAGGQAGLNDYGVAITVDHQNNSYVAAAITAANGFFDFAVLKYDMDGNLQWTATWDGSHHLHDIPTAITLDDAENIIVTGGTTSFTQQMDYAVVKFNSAGTRLWSTTYDYANLYDFPTAIQKATNDNIAVTGASASAANSWDYATILVNGATGQIQNVNRVNVPEIGLDQPLAVARDPQNNLFITGYNEKDGNKNIQTVKLNSNFGLEWIQSYDAGGLEDMAKSIGCDAWGNVYVAGHSKTAQEGNRFTVLKYDSQGNLLWNQTYKPYTYDGAQAAAIKVMPTGDFYLTGTIQKGTETDFATLKYTKDGEVEWEKRYGGSGADEATTIEADNFGNVYVSGISEDATAKKYSTVKYSNFQPPYNIVYQSNGKPSHIAQELIVKFSPSEVNPNFVNDSDWLYGSAESILSTAALDKMQTVLPFSLRDNQQVVFSKIFTTLKTTDTISMTRLGDSVPIPAFWSALLMHLPEYTDMNAVKYPLNQLFPLIEYCHVNAIGRKSSIPNDTYISRQSSLIPNAAYRNAHINIDSAWNITTGSKRIKVGVYDDPIYWKHPDFGGANFNKSVVKGGRDYYNNIAISSIDTPRSFHGTKVAGIIGAMRNNGQGVAGIAGGDLLRADTGVSLYSMGIFRLGLFAATTAAAEAIQMGATSVPTTPTAPSGFGLNIQNHSWGTDLDSIDLLRNAIRFAFVNNCLVVTSRGNEADRTIQYPACFQDEWVISVGASGQNGQLKTEYNSTLDKDVESSFDNGMDLIAPGSFDNVYTTALKDSCRAVNDMYSCFNGTSASAPHVAGTAALMLGLHNTSNGYPNNLAPDDVEHILSKYAKDVDDVGIINIYNNVGTVLRRDTVLYERGYDEYNGWGLLNAGAALRMINRPKYYIWHPNNNATLLPMNLRRAGRSVSLKEKVNGINAGRYPMDVYEVTEQYTIKLAPNLQLIDSWKRLSGSKGYKDTSVLQDDPWVNIISNTVSPDPTGDVVDIWMNSFFYKVLDSTTRQAIGWIPYSPNTQRKFAYSLHLKDKNAVATKELDNKNYVEVYPNPSTGFLTIDYKLTEIPHQLQVAIFDITGRLLYTDEMPTLIQSKFTMDIQSFVQGTYMVRLRINNESIYRKIIKI